MRTTFRARMFAATAVSAAVALAAAAWLTAYALRQRTVERIERGLIAQAKLAAALIGDLGPTAPPPWPDEEADRLGRGIEARVTLIAPDGRVLGDSAEDGAALAAMENHGRRPEVLAAGAGDVGVARRYSTTVGTDMLYVAVRTAHPTITFVRLALPLTEVGEQLQSIRNIALLALALTLPGALALSWVLSSVLGRRVEAIARVARSHASGRDAPAPTAYGSDELGTIGRALDDSFRQLGEKLSEQARDRARLEAILAGMTEGVLLVDPRGRIQLANEAACRMLKLATTPLGRPYVELVRHPDIVALISAALEGRAAGPVELALWHDADASVAARAGPVAAPEESSVVLVLHDISALRRADRMRRDFVANVSHELRTPLTAIRGYVEALRDEPPGEAGRQRFLAIIDQHAQRMERLVRDLLKLARVEAGFETTEPIQTDLGDLLRAVVADFAPVTRSRGQRIEVDIGRGAETLVTDPYKLGDVLRNLLENALNYGGTGATIRIETRRVGSTLELRVLDQGPGIPEAELSRIFERFYRVDKSRSAASGGTGLGLSIAKRLVDRLGGEIRAANRVEGGAVFTVTLPLSAERLSAQPL